MDTIDAKDIVNSQQGSDPSLASQPQTVDNADVPQMDLERVLPRQQSTGLSRGIQQLGSPNVYVDSGNEQIIVQKDVPQVLMGNQPTFGEGFYVTKTGVNVTTAKSLDDFVFNSNQNILKIVKADYILASFAGASYSYSTVPHNLGYIPLVQAYVYGSLSISGAAFFPLPYAVVSSLDLVNQVVQYNVQVDVFADSQNLYVEGLNATPTATGSYYIRYYLFQESLPAPA